jgi:hypothetical protein
LGFSIGIVLCKSTKQLIKKKGGGAKKKSQHIFVPGKKYILAYWPRKIEERQKKKVKKLKI